jgi:hypothetical protein
LAEALAFLLASSIADFSAPEISLGEVFAGVYPPFDTFPRY